MTKTQKIVFGIVAVIALALLARFVVFKKAFDTWGEGLDRIGSWQDSYKQEHPDASKEDMRNAFDEGMENIKQWQDNYKKDHPGATDAEMEAAFNAQWEK